MRFKTMHKVYDFKRRFGEENMCVGCGQCTTKCKFDAIHLERVYDGEGVKFLDMKPVVVKQMVKRQGKIAAKKVKSLFGGKN